MKNLFIVFCILSFNMMALGNACDRDCRRQGPNVPCGTWRKPLRTCPSFYDEPICASERTLCNQTFAACLVASLIAYEATPTCIDLIYETGINPLSIETCGIAAESLQIAYNNCR